MLSREQADAVVAAVAQDAPVRRISPVAGIVGYIGGVLASDCGNGGGSVEPCRRGPRALRRPGTLLIGVIVSAHAALAYRLRSSGRQQIALFAGVLTTAAGVLILLGGPDPAVPVAYWALGLGWAGIAWINVVRPRRLGAGRGAVTAVFGTEGLTFSSDTWGILLVLATLAVPFVAAALAREPVSIAVG